MNIKEALSALYCYRKAFKLGHLTVENLQYCRQDRKIQSQEFLLTVKTQPNRKKTTVSIDIKAEEVNYLQFKAAVKSKINFDISVLLAKL